MPISHKDADDITCPKCGHRQQGGKECIQCGLIFKKCVQAEFAEDLSSGKILVYDCNEAGKKKLLVFLSLLLILILFIEGRDKREITYPPGILIKSEPQMALVSDPKPWKAGHKEIYPMVEFWLQGRVLSSERYYHDPLSDVSPIDIGLGWGPMSDQSVVDKLVFTQANRILTYDLVDPSQPPVSYGSLWKYFKNVHTLPADNFIKKKVCSVLTGDLIELRGYLVRIKENGQWTAVSSLRRESGLDHTTCLIFWITDFKRL